MKKREIVIFFGRCNPPTKAHVMVWNYVKDIATERKCDHKVFITHSHDGFRNPIPPKVKFGWCKKIAPHISFMLTGKASGVLTFLDAMRFAIKKGYTEIAIVAGDDRTELESLAKEYITEPCTISFISSGNRKQDFVLPNSGSIMKMEEISGTKLRDFVYSLMHSEDAFSLMPDQLTRKQKIEMYYDILIGSGYLSNSSKLRNEVRKKYLTTL